jgi:regulator of RNase E activity RraA
MTEEGTVLVIEQPEGQTCAAIGGIMALRMSLKDVAGCVVGGRVRDVAELEKCGLPVSRTFPNFRTTGSQWTTWTAQELSNLRLI